MNTANTQLIDLGERRIVSEVLSKRYGSVRNWGDDAALLSDGPLSGSGWLVGTTDPCPPPMSAALGFADWYYTGWLLATINISDIAAAGARPLGLLTSLILPAQTLLSDFNRLLDGVDACCRAADTRVVGGNLKEAPDVSLSGAAIGIAKQAPVSRHGAHDGDRIGVIGEIGSFWAAVLGIRNGLVETDPADPLLTNVLVPPPKADVMARLAEAGLVRAAIDTSDGVYPALAQLGAASNVSMVIDRSVLTFEPRVLEVAEAIGLDPLRLALGWGDWQVVIAYSLSDEAAIAEIAEGTFTAIGDVASGAGVFVRDEIGDARRLFPLESERFVRNSWFSAGLEGYVEALTKGPLYAD